MGIRALRFNTYLLLLAALVALTGCQTEARLRKKQVSVLGVHLEARADATDRTGPVKVFRSNPLVFNVTKDPFLNEGMVQAAGIIEHGPEAFSIRVEFDDHGTRILEMISAQNQGKRAVISCTWGKKLEHQRYLAAPVMPRRIGNGVLVFTADVDRAEAEDIVLGLNNLAAKVQKGSFTER